MHCLHALWSLEGDLNSNGEMEWSTHKSLLPSALTITSFSSSSLQHASISNDFKESEKPHSYSDQ